MIYLFCKMRPGQRGVFIFCYQHLWPELRGGFYLADALSLAHKEN